MAEEFNGRMHALSEELQTRKEERLAKAERNQAIRQKIQKAIDDYKVKEQQYRKDIEN